MPQPAVNAVYYPSWKVYKGHPPSSLQVDAATHILYAFVRVNEDGSLRLLDEWGDLKKDVDGEKGCLAALAKLKRQNPHIKTLVSLGGGSGSAEFPKLAANPHARQKFAREVHDFCDRYDFDGIDIDWEHPTCCDDGENYLKLLQAARKTLPAPRYILSSALPVGDYCLKHIDLRAAANILDFLNMMGYDFTGAWTDVSGHHAQLYPPSGDLSHVHPTLRNSCSRGVDYILSRGFPAHKILLGVPVYARHFPKARGPGQPFSEAGEMEYSEMPVEWVQGAKVDMKTGAASYLDTCYMKGFVSFDVPRTVVMKAKFAKEKGLGGLFYWTGAGDRDGSESLIAAGYEELVRTSC